MLNEQNWRHGGEPESSWIHSSQNVTHCLHVIMETLNLSTTGKITKQNCSKKLLLNFVEAQSNVNLRRVRLKILRDCAPHWLTISIVHKHIKVI